MIELGGDGLFRNVTINNNRTAASRIPKASGAFLAVRAAMGSEISSRILQPGSKANFAEAEGGPAFTRPSDYSWYGLYPSSNYQLKKSAFPVRMRWSGIAPVIPYDTEASTLPLVMFVVQAENRSGSAMDISAMMNWENLNGCSRDSFPEERGAIAPLFYDIDTELVRVDTGLLAGLGFAQGSKVDSNHHGNYTLAAPPLVGAETSAARWAMDDAASAAALWRAFHQSGQIGNEAPAGETAHGGAVCQTKRAGPGESVQFIFILSWFFPQYIVKGEDQGNGYTNRYISSADVVAYAMKHYQYFLDSIQKWHNRFLHSSLPPWFSRMLLNGTGALTTNTLLDKQGRFSMFETPEDPLVGALDRSFYSSFGTLLHFPDLAQRELALFAEAGEDGEAFHLPAILGRECFHQPMKRPHRGEQLDLIPKFILMAYRNYAMTGNLPALRKLYPQLKRAVECALSSDTDGDGLPDTRGVATTFSGWESRGANSYISGLWVAALQAFAELATHLDRPQEAKECREIAGSAAASIEKSCGANRGVATPLANRVRETTGTACAIAGSLRDSGRRSSCA